MKNCSSFSMIKKFFRFNEKEECFRKEIGFNSIQQIISLLFEEYGNLVTRRIYLTILYDFCFALNN